MNRQQTIVLLIVIALFAFGRGVSFAQLDSTSLQKNDTIGVQPSAGFLTQFAFSSIGFAIGFIPGGYQQIYDDTHNTYSKGTLWNSLFPFITPILTSVGTDFAATNFWKNKNVRGSYWGGVLGGFLGELIGAVIRFDLLDYHHSVNPIYLYMGLWLPTSLMTVLVYNLFGILSEPLSTNILLYPHINKNGGVLHMQIKF